MAADGSGVQVNLHRSDALTWVLISRAPDTRLKPFVIDYQGYRERSRAPMRRLQAPFAGVPMIVTFGPSIDIINGDRPAERGLYRSFLAGLHDVHVFTEYQGEQMGLQVNSPCSAPIASSTSPCRTLPIAASGSAIWWATARRTGWRMRSTTRRTGRRASISWTGSCSSACAADAPCRRTLSGR